MTSLPLEDLPEPPLLDSFDSFDEFWAVYPRKVGKLVALTEYLKALKRAAHADIMSGLRLYLKTKPAYADWCHPRTWLNQGRWMDEPDAKPVKPAEQSLENAAWCIRHGTSGGYILPVSPENVRACIDAGMVTEEQARPWLG